MKKGLSKFIAVVLAAGILAGGVCACGYVSRDDDGKWFQVSDFKAWSWNKDKPQAEQGKVFDTAGREMVSGVTYSMPAAMAIYSDVETHNAEEPISQVITITAQQSFTLNNVKVDWAVTDANGFDMSSFVSVTPSSDGSLTANVQFLMPFNEQLRLKVTARDGGKNSTYCTLDCIKRVNSLNNVYIVGTDFDDSAGIGFHAEMGIGTINIPFTVSNISNYVQDDFQIAVKNYLTFDIEFQSYDVESVELEETSNESAFEVDYGNMYVYSMFIKDFNDYDQNHKNAIYYAWYNAYKDMKKANGNQFFNNILVDVEITQSYQEQVLYTYTASGLSGSENVPNYLTGSYYGSDLSPNLTLNQNYVF